MPLTEEQRQAIRDEEFFRNEVRKELEHKGPPGFLERCSAFLETTVELYGVLMDSERQVMATTTTTTTSKRKQGGMIRGCFLVARHGDRSCQAVGRAILDWLKAN